MGLMSPAEDQHFSFNASRNFNRDSMNQTGKTMGSEMKKGGNTTNGTNLENEKNLLLGKKQDGNGLESDGSDEDADAKKPKKSKKPTEANIKDVIEKSRNYNRLVKKNKSRVFAEDLE
jgi:hypothetical protein